MAISQKYTTFASQFRKRGAHPNNCYNKKLGYGVIGNTTDSGPVILGSSPGIPTIKAKLSFLNLAFSLYPKQKIFCHINSLAYICNRIITTIMKKELLTMILPLFMAHAGAQDQTIDISGDNTDKNYISYSENIYIGAGKTCDVKMARYCYFSSTVTGTGTMNLYAGGERCYLGTSKGATWPNWSGFKGNIHIFPFPENSSKAGFYGVVMAHGGKSFSPENVEDAVRSGKVNNSMQNSYVTLHKGATICCEANTNGAGFRIGELNTEEGSIIQGYMKKNTRAAYFLVGYLGTDATLAGTIAPPSYSDTHPVGIIKEGKGTYRITGNENYLTGTLRVLEGTVLAMNDVAEAKSRGMRGALGAKPDENEAIAFVFQNGILGGTGSIGGTVDNYGTINPGDEHTGTLTLQNYVSTSANTHLYVRPASVLHFDIASDTQYDQLKVNGAVKYYNMTQDFSTSEKMPLISIHLEEDAGVKVGDEFTLLTAKSKGTGDWCFNLQKPEKYTWELVESEEDENYTVKLRLVSFKDQETQAEDPDESPEEKEHMGAFYDDGVNDATDMTTLRQYAKNNDKFIGTAISTWKNDITNEALAETREVGQQFNMLVAENEMKWDALEPSRGSFNYWAADNLVSYAQRHNMSMRGHCLAWHSQLPTWVSSDGKKNDQNWSREEALQILKSHITNVVKHFKGKVKEWDVVNECLNDDQTTVRTNPEGYDLRQSVWMRAIGEDYIDSAFVYAHEADPDAKLYLNDYDVELQGKAKSVAFYNLAMRLKADNIPIDGVGLQCHFSVGDVDSVKLAKTIERFGEAGLKCIITELDMGISSTTASNLEEQARNYRVITDIMLKNDNCHALVIWGLKDNDSWRSSSSPLLYDAGLGKKPAFYAVRSALRHASIEKEKTTGIETVQDLPSMTEKSDVIYNLAGQRVDKNYKGIVIVNGQKYLLK